MNPIDLIFISTKTMKAYEAFCQPVCKKFQLNQTSFDVLMFLANNPKYNTARDICEIRGIRTGIASVAVDFLVSNGYLLRQPDDIDRRIWRLLITEKKCSHHSGRSGCSAGIWKAPDSWYLRRRACSLYTNHTEIQRKYSCNYPQ